MEIDYIDYLRDLGINFIAIYIYAYVIYYRRHYNRDMTITLAMFNMFLFTIVLTMTTTEFNIAAGFALFALLSMISLRSVNISKVEVAYLFGAITLGLVNGISLDDYLLLAIGNIVVIGTAATLDCKHLIKNTVTTDYTLKGITLDDLRTKNRIKEKINEESDLIVLSYDIKKYNAKKMTVQLSVQLQL